MNDRPRATPAEFRRFAAAVGLTIGTVWWLLNGAMLGWLWLPFALALALWFLAPVLPE